MLLVLVKPLVAVVRHQLVPAEAGVDQAVDEAGGQILPRRVDVGAERRPGVVQVGFVDILWSFGLHDVQLMDRCGQWVKRWAGEGDRRGQTGAAGQTVGRGESANLCNF